MIEDPETGTLKNCTISAVAHEGLSVTTRDGEPGIFAILDKNGNVIERGPAVAAEAWNVAVASYRNFLKGQGWLRVRTQPADPD